MKRRTDPSWRALPAILLAMAASPAASAGAADDWPSFRGDPALTGVARGILPRQPVVLWTWQAGAGIESTPAVQSGAVYVGAMDGTLTCLQLDTGAPRWKYAATGPIKSSPVVSEETVYVGDDMGTFHAVGAKDGKKRWSFKTGAAIVSSATVVAGRVVFGSNDNYLYGLSAADGSLIWKIETAGYVYGSPAATARFGEPAVVSAGCDGFLRIVKVRDGSEIRRIEMGAYVGASPALKDDAAFVGTFENEFLAIDLAGGKILWRYEHPERKFPYYASAAVSGGTVVVGGRDRLVHALEAATGREIWSWAAGSKVDASPVIVNDRVVVATAGGDIVTLSLGTGEAGWKFETGAGIAGSPAVASGRLLIGTDAGTLYVFGEKR